MSAQQELDRHNSSRPCGLVLPEESSYRKMTRVALGRKTPDDRALRSRPVFHSATMPADLQIQSARYIKFLYTIFTAMIILVISPDITKPAQTG